GQGRRDGGHQPVAGRARRGEAARDHGAPDRRRRGARGAAGLTRSCEVRRGVIRGALAEWRSPPTGSGEGRRRSEPERGRWQTHCVWQATAEAAKLAPVRAAVFQLTYLQSEQFLAFSSPPPPGRRGNCG